MSWKHSSQLEYCRNVVKTSPAKLDWGEQTHLNFNTCNPAATASGVKDRPNQERQKIGIQKEFETFHYEFQMNP